MTSEKESPRRIQQLPPLVVDQIAAGEVVERPASAIKELVENSLDAGARSLRVELEEGGRSLLVVEDDGSGIHPDDLLLAVTSHATSKIRSVDDLSQVRSMGFRGEALASIASVSKFKLMTRQAGGEGHMIACEGGRVVDRRPCSAKFGTRIEVSDLFYNIPARRKFLKASAAEMQACVKACQRLCLARPDVRFEVFHGGKEVMLAPAAASAVERIADIFGPSMVKGLIPLSAERKGWQLNGLVGPAAQGKNSAAFQFFFLNGRPVRDKTLLAAVKEAYSGLMVGRRFPVVFLYLDMDPEEVDVNVHPCKTEVRFVDTSAVFSFFFAAIRDAVGAHKAAPSLASEVFRPERATEEDSEDSETGAAEEFRPKPLGPSPESEAPPPLPPGRGGRGVRSESLSFSTVPPGRGGARSESLSFSTVPPGRGGATSEALSFSTAPPGRAGMRSEALDFPHPSQGTLAFDVPAPRPPLAPAWAESLGRTRSESRPRFMQFLKTYIVEEGSEGLRIHDQHALHEKILYLNFRRSLQSRGLVRQALLIPEIVDLSPADVALTEEFREAFLTAGIEVDAFSDKSVAVRSVPDLARRRAPGALFAAALEHLRELSFAERQLPEKIVDGIMASMACKAAVKAGDSLDDAEIAALLEQASGMADVQTCPHGRPTALVLSKADLERQFHRTL